MANTIEASKKILQGKRVTGRKSSTVATRKRSGLPDRTTKTPVPTVSATKKIQKTKQAPKKGAQTKKTQKK